MSPAMTLDEASALAGLPEGQRRVEYRPDPDSGAERGTVMHVTAKYVFVAYDGRGGGWRATLPQDLHRV